MTVLAQAPDYGGLLDRLYAAAQRPERWEQFLEHFADHTTDGFAALHRYRLGSGSGAMMTSVRIDASWVRRYDEHFAGVNIWMKQDPRPLRPGQLNLNAERVSDRDLLRSEWYNDFLRPQALRYSLGAVARREADEVVTLSTLRGERAGPYGEPERQVYRFLLPHLVRVFEIERSLRRADQAARSASAALDRLPFGVVQIGADGRVRTANEFAAGLFAERDGLDVRQGRLVAASSAETGALRHALTATLAVARGDLAVPAAPVSLSRPSGKRSYCARFCPLREADGSPLGSSGVLVFLSDPERAAATAPADLRGLFGLSEREASLLADLVEGRDLAESASHLGLTSETARTYLKRVFDKTGTHRQAELVGMVLRSVAALARAEPPRAAVGRRTPKSVHPP